MTTQQGPGDSGAAARERYEGEETSDREKQAASGNAEDPPPEGEDVPTEDEAGETYEESSDEGEELEEAPEDPEDETEQEREAREDRNRKRRSRGLKCRYCGASLEAPAGRTAEGATEREQSKRAACETCGTIEGQRFPPGHPKGRQPGETESGGQESPWSQDPPPPASIADVFANPPESRADSPAIRAAEARRRAEAGLPPYPVAGGPPEAEQLPADAPMGHGEGRRPAPGAPVARPAPGTPKPGTAPKPAPRPAPGAPRPGIPPPPPKPGTGPAKPGAPRPGAPAPKPGASSSKLPHGWAGGGSR